MCSISSFVSLKYNFTAAMGAGKRERAHTKTEPKVGPVFGPVSRAVYIVLLMGGGRQAAPIFGPRFSQFCSFSRTACAGLWGLVAGTDVGDGVDVDHDA